MSYAQKMRQANREAAFAVGALAATVFVWVLLGYGLEWCPITVFGLPLWVVAGCMGTWLFAIAVAVVFSSHVMVDCDLDDEESNGAGPAAAATSAPAEPAAGPAARPHGDATTPKEVG